MPAHSTPLMPPAPQGKGNPLNPEGRSERSRADCCGLAEVPVRCLAGETFILLAKYLGKLPDLLAASEAAIGLVRPLPAPRSGFSAESCYLRCTAGREEVEKGK